MYQLFRANRNAVYNAICSNTRYMAILGNIRSRYNGHKKAFEFVYQKAKELKINLSKNEIMYLASQLWLDAWYTEKET